MKKSIVLFMVFFVSAFLFSYEYIMNTSPSGIGSFTSNVQITTLTGGTWDEGYYDLVLPAANQFYYYGKLVTHLRICTNGYVVMGYGSPSGGSYLNSSIPTTSFPNSIVAPLWDDYDLRSAGTMWYQIVQNFNGNNYVTVEWRGVPHWGSLTAYSFSCTFCNSTNCIRANTIIFTYSQVNSSNIIYDNGASATVGIENSTGTQGEQFSFNEAIVTNWLKITFTPFVSVYGSTTDLGEPSTNDGYPDAIVFRPSNGYWYCYNSTGTTNSFLWGMKGDIAVPGDYDGDGDADPAVFRPSNSTWYSYGPNFTKAWGTTGDIPVPADYNGDGSLDIAVFRPSNGNWYVYNTGGSAYTHHWGTAGDIPLPADYDGDNISDLAVFRPSNNTWYIHKSSDEASWIKIWGTAGDIPMPVNWYSSNSNICVFRPSNGNWYYLDQRYNVSIWAHWGQDGDQPVPADANMVGPTDYAVFRPSASAKWYLNSTSYFPDPLTWGTLGDKPRLRRAALIVSPPPTSGARP